MWIEDEIPAKLRFGYLLYYSLTNIIDQINEKIGTHFNMKQDMKSPSVPGFARMKATSR